MAYLIEPVDRAELPPGADWAFVHGPGDDVRFMLARDSGPIVLPDEALCYLLQEIAKHTEVAEVLPGDERPVFKVVV